METAMILYVFVCLLLWFLLINANQVRKSCTNKWEPINFVLFSPVLLIIYVVIILTLPLGKLIQTIIAGMIKIKFGDKYHDIVTGTDLMMSCNKWQHSFIKIFLIIERNKTTATQSLYEHTKQLMEKNRAQNKMHEKFFTTLEQCFGYLFFKKLNLEISECVRKMPLSRKTLDRDELLQVLRKCIYEPLPLNNTALWDIQVGTQPLEWRSNLNPNIEYYPVLIRTHHGITDGTSLVKHLKHLFEDEIDETTSKPITLNNLEQKSIVCNLFKKVAAFFNLVVLFISALYITLFVRGHDSNDLHGKPFTNNDVFQFVTDEGGEYFKKVKKIKKMHGDISFSEVVLAAYSASLYEYYQKHSSSCPESITIALPVVLNRGYLEGIKTGQTKDIHVKNNFIFLQMNLPIDITKNKQFDSKTPNISRLNIIRKVTKNLRNTSQEQFSYILVHLFLGCLPVELLRNFLATLNSTTAGSLLPGPSKFSYCNGAFTVSDCLFWLPHVIQLGLAFSTLTFDDRLQMGLTCNGQICEQSHVNEILHNIYKHIDLTDKELQFYFNTK